MRVSLRRKIHLEDICGIIYVYMISIPFLCKYMATWGDKGSKKQEVAKAEQTTSVGRAARCEVRGGRNRVGPYR